MSKKIAIDGFLTTHTQVCPLQRLVGKPDLEPAALLLSVKPGNGEAGSVHRDRIANVAIAKDWGCIRDGQCAPPAIESYIRNGSQMFDLRTNKSIGRYSRRIMGRTRPVNIV